MAGTQTFFNAQDKDGTSAPINMSYSTGTTIFTCWSPTGDWDGASLTFNRFANDGTAIPVQDEDGNLVVFTEDGSRGMTYIVYNEPIVAVLANSGDNTIVSATVDGTVKGS